MLNSPPKRGGKKADAWAFNMGFESDAPELIDVERADLICHAITNRF